jgi:TonB family protein
MLRTSAVLSLAVGLFPVHLQASPQRVQVERPVSQGLLITKVDPVYPPIARQARIQGTVLLRAVISKEGSIEELTLVSGHPMLVQAAIDAVKQWKYKPYLLNSEPVEVDTEIQVNFTLSPTEPPPPVNAAPAAPLVGAVGLSENEAAQAAAASRSGSGGQESNIGLGTGARGRLRGSLDILSDTQGVDFGPFLSLAMQRVRDNWYHLIPESATRKKGKLAIEFAISKDGQISSMKLVASSGDVYLDRPAWGSITASNPFPALPPEFGGQYLALRFRFYYNPDKSDAARDAQTSGVVGPSPKPEEGVSPDGKLYHRGEGASNPRIIAQVDPEFSEKARQAKFQGLCVLSIIIEPDGTPSNIQVSRKLGMGLDEKAIEAVKQWRFQPAMKDGHPVRYGPVEVDVDFHIQKDEFPHP